MKYPSQLLSTLADFLEEWEPHERLEALANRVEAIEEPVEMKLDAIKDRLTAYSQLREAREEVRVLKEDRAALVRAYSDLGGLYKKKTGEALPKPSARTQEAFRRGLRDIKPHLRQVLEIMQGMKHRTRA